MTLLWWGNESKGKDNRRSFTAFRMTRFLGLRMGVGAALLESRGRCESFPINAMRACDAFAHSPAAPDHGAAPTDRDSLEEMKTLSDPQSRQEILARLAMIRPETPRL